LSVLSKNTNQQPFLTNYFRIKGSNSHSDCKFVLKQAILSHYMWKYWVFRQKNRFQSIEFQFISGNNAQIRILTGDLFWNGPFCHIIYQNIECFVKESFSTAHPFHFVKESFFLGGERSNSNFDSIFVLKPTMFYKVGFVILCDYYSTDHADSADSETVHVENVPFRNKNGGIFGKSPFLFEKNSILSICPRHKQKLSKNSLTGILQQPLKP